MPKFFTRPPLGTPLNPAHPLNRGLVGYWGFGEGAGSKTQDLSGNNNHGTLTNMVQGATSGWTGGKFGGAIRFDGTDDEVLIADNVILKPTVVTASAWFLSGGGGGYILFKQNTRTSYSEGYSLYTIASVVGAALSSVGGVQNVVEVARVQNKWHHVLMTFVRPTLSIYLDGVFIKSITHDYVMDFGTRPVSIGRSTEPTFLYPYAGQMSEARIYNRALSAQEVQQLYTDPFCMYERMNIFLKFIQRGSFFFSKK